MVKMSKTLYGGGYLLCLFLMMDAAQLTAQLHLRAGAGASFVNSGWEGKDPYKKRGASDPLAFYSVGAHYMRPGLGRFNLGAGLHLSRQGYAFRIYNFYDQDLAHARRSMLAATLYGVSRLTLYQAENKKHTSLFGIQAGAYGSLLFAHRWKFADHPIRAMGKISSSGDAGLLVGLFFQSTGKNGRIQTWDMKYFNGLPDISRSPAFELTRLRYFETGYSVSISKVKRKKR